MTTPTRPAAGAKTNQPNGGTPTTATGACTTTWNAWLSKNFLTAHPGQVLHSTTNIAESPGARIAAVCYHHRRLSESHLLTAVDWTLYYRWVAPKPPKQIYTQWHHAGRPQRRIIPKRPKKNIERIGPARYDTHTIAEEGLWTRKGWAGRSN